MSIAESSIADAQKIYQDLRKYIVQHETGLEFLKGLSTASETRRAFNTSKIDERIQILKKEREFEEKNIDDEINEIQQLENFIPNEVQEQLLLEQLEDLRVTRDNMSMNLADVLDKIKQRESLNFMSTSLSNALSTVQLEEDIETRSDGHHQFQPPQEQQTIYNELLKQLESVQNLLTNNKSS